MISKCGVICKSDCGAFDVECEGCNELQGRVSWAEFYGKTECPIYACVTAKGLETCADCGKAPCELWHSTRNPDASDEAFAADLASRLRNLSAITSR